MPYIAKNKRELYDIALCDMPLIESKGELEYCVFKLMKRYMADKEMRYSTLHDCVYAVAHSSDEFRRRFLDKREEDAIAKNGDIE